MKWLNLLLEGSMKFIVKVEGIKKKQQTNKTHDFIVALEAKINDSDRLMEVAKGLIETNMKTVNRAVLMGFGKNQQGMFENLPAIIKEIK